MDSFSLTSSTRFVVLVLCSSAIFSSSYSLNLRLGEELKYEHCILNERQHYIFTYSSTSFSNLPTVLERISTVSVNTFTCSLSSPIDVRKSSRGGMLNEYARHITHHISQPNTNTFTYLASLKSCNVDE